MAIQSLLQANDRRRRQLIAESQRLAAIFYAQGALDVWVFGSVVGGIVTPTSDLDLAVVLEPPPQGDKPGSRLQQARALIMAGNPLFPVDLIVVRPGEIEQAIARGDPQWQCARKVKRN